MSGAEVAAALGLASAASWGGADFSAGLAARRGNTFTVGAVSRAVGVPMLVGWAIVSTERAPSVHALAWGLAAGLVIAIGLAALYQSLAIGRMGINSSLTAVLAASFPVLFGAVSQGLPAPLRAAGFGLALAGVWCVSQSPGTDVGRSRGLGLALIAGICFGSFYVLIIQVGISSVFWPLAASTVMSLVVLSALALGSRQARLLAPTVLPISLLAGVLDTVGTIFFVLAAHASRLDIVAVLASLYPAVTVLMARVILKEHVTRRQAVGIVAVLTAIPLIVG